MNNHFYIITTGGPEVIIFRGSMRELLDCGFHKEHISNLFKSYEDALIWAGMVAGKLSVKYQKVSIITEY